VLINGIDITSHGACRKAQEQHCRFGQTR
jgi:hypothetical protein